MFMPDNAGYDSNDPQPENFDEARNMGWAYYSSDEDTQRLKDPKVKAEWIKALRSGKYQQGHNRLTTIDPYTKSEKHCCLGVQCVIDPKIIPVFKSVSTGGRTYSFAAYSELSLVAEQNGMLDPEYAEYLGITPTGAFNTKVRLFGEDLLFVYSLVECNDADMSFNQIADVLEYFF